MLKHCISCGDEVLVGSMFDPFGPKTVICNKCGNAPTKKKFYDIEIQYAREVAHTFVNVSEMFTTAFREWMNNKDSPILMYEHHGYEYFLNRELVCVMIIKEVE